MRIFVTLALLSLGLPLDLYRLASGKLCPPAGDSTKAAVRELNKFKNRANVPGPGDFQDPRPKLADFLEAGDDEERWDENKAATIIGYVVNVKPGGSETCNCHATDLQDRDTHIEIGETPDAPPRKRMIVEVSPRLRAAMKTKGIDWSTATLEKTLKGRRVQVTGWLFWDAEHVHNAENTNPGNAANWRNTAWEVHPLTKIEVLDP